MASRSSMLLFAKGEEEDQINQAQPQVVPSKKRRRKFPDPNAEVIALSPTTLMAENKFVCEVCSKGFPREQNLELHKRRHNLPWKFKQKSACDQDEVKRKVYLCPVSSCIHHDPCYALGDFTGVKKHYSRKHGEKKYKCAKCMKMYAVHSDLKAHLKTCSTKEYRCNCGTLFSRRDSFITHRAFCEALGVGSEMKHSPTASDMGVSSSKNTANRNNIRQMGVPVTHCGSRVSSIQNLTRNALTSTHAVSQLSQISIDSLMNRHSMDLNHYKPSPFATTPYEQQNKHNNQGNVDPNFITNLTDNTTIPCNNTESYNISYMGNFKNCEIGKGLNLLSGGSSVYHPASVYLPRSDTNVMPQLSATALLQKAALISSTSSNINATNVSRVYASTSLSDPIGGTTFEHERFLAGNKMCNSSESNEHDNMNVLLNSFSNNRNESLIFTQYAGTTYKQEVSYQDGHGCNNDEYQYSQSIGSSMCFQQSRGITFTRDFLGVGGAIVGDTSSDEPPSSFIGRSFL